MVFVASGVASATVEITNLVVANCSVFVPLSAVGAVGVPVKAGEANGALSVNPFTIGAAAVPVKSPANLIVPKTWSVALGT